jgi:hypothetical protein
MNDEQIRSLWLNDPTKEKSFLYLNRFTRASLQECTEALMQNTSCRHLELHGADGIQPPIEAEQPPIEADWVSFGMRSLTILFQMA